ncbi:MAG: aminodeoxychorismate/anthranilate synthase component II [Planctomycetes bacterium]|nr:aminodeoxychorismate/anthranilate synthase component II [Planctomycetota bacterium]
MSVGTLVLDNYDSFTWNLVALLRRLGDQPRVVRADRWKRSELTGAPRLLISPGPGRPENLEVPNAALREALGRMPVLGVCLGHQCLGHHFGMRIDRAPQPMHGRTSCVQHDGQGLFAGIPSPLRVMRYHSLVVHPSIDDPELDISAWFPEDDGRLIMGLRHRELPVAGVQFHPDSFLTEQGLAMMENFLRW